MSTQTRPRQTTFAGGMIILGSVFLLLSVWEAVTGLRDIESREAIEDFLADPPGSELGLSVEGTLQILRGVATVAGVCSAVAAVLGVYALRGHRPARVGLSVLAVPIFVTGIVAGGFMSSIVAVAIALLWLSPSREWFRGEHVPDRTTTTDAARSAVWPPALPHDTSSSSAPGGSTATGQQPGGTEEPEAQGGSTALDQPPAPGGASPYGQPRAQQGAWPALPPVPTAISVLVMALSPDVMMEEVLRQQPDLEEQGVTEQMLRSTTFVMGGIVIAWAATAIVLAFLTLGRRRGAARALMVSAVLSTVLCVVGTFASLLLALPAFASIITVAVLRRPEVRAWLDRGRT